MASKRMRSGRVSEEQLIALVDFFENNKGLAQGKFLAVNGKESYDAKWNDLAEELNKIRGGHKTVAQWQITWRDLKSRTSVKIRNIRNGRAATGNNEVKESKLTPLDLRVVGLIGADYVEGSAVCPDSIPEEEDLQERLIAGDRSVVDLPPTVITVIEANGIEVTHEAQEEFVDDDLMERAYDTCIHQSDSAFDTCIQSDNCIQVSNIENIQDKENINIQSSNKGYVKMNKKAVKRNYLNQPIRKKMPTSEGNRTRIGIQLQAARQEFADISNKHAEAMLMLAEAAKIQAESSVRMANAAERQAEAAIQQAANDARRIEVFERLTDVLSKILPEYA